MMEFIFRTASNVSDSEKVKRYTLRITTRAIKFTSKEKARKKRKS